MTEPDSTTDARNSSSDDGGVSRRQFVAVAGTAAVGAIGLGSAAARNDGGQMDRSFTVRLENKSDGRTLSTTGEGDASSAAVPLAPVVYAVHSRDEPIYSRGERARDNGLEAVAEDGNPEALASHLMDRDTVLDAGAVAVPVGGDGPGPLMPGDAYEFSTDATSGSPRPYLSLVTMFVQSNDLFYSLGGPSGVPLFDGDGPTSGNQNDRIALWDAGTEVNQEPGVGEHQAPRQRAANVGDVERGTVVPVADVNGYDYPAVEEVVNLRITPH